MRTLINIPDDDLKLLNELSAAKGVSRAELIRRAVRASLAPHRAATLVEGLALWDGPEDGLAYQERMRNEWSEREREQFSTQTS